MPWVGSFTIHRDVGYIHRPFLFYRKIEPVSKSSVDPESVHRRRRLRGDRSGHNRIRSRDRDLGVLVVKSCIVLSVTILGG